MSDNDITPYLPGKFRQPRPPQLWAILTRSFGLALLGIPTGLATVFIIHTIIGLVWGIGGASGAPIDFVLAQVGPTSFVLGMGCCIVAPWSRALNPRPGVHVIRVAVFAGAWSWMFFLVSPSSLEPALAGGWANFHLIALVACLGWSLILLGLWNRAAIATGSLLIVISGQVSPYIVRALGSSPRDVPHAIILTVLLASLVLGGVLHAEVKHRRQLLGLDSKSVE